MQDRFKFRIWNGIEMHYNDFVVTATGYVGKITEEFLGNCVFNQEDLTADKESTLMQCTGLKDKNGKLVYEGDILKCYYIDSDTDKLEYDLMKAVFNEETCAFALVGLKTKNYEYFTDTEFISDEYEVIGNIYENSELLEG